MSDNALPIPGSAAVTAPAKVGRAITRVRTPTSTGRVISNLYYNVMSLKLKSDPMALQFIASHPGEGTSLIAAQFATFAAGLASGTVLLIDCTASGRPPAAPRQRIADAWTGPSLLEAYLEDGRIDRAITTNGPADSPHVAVLAGRTNSSLHDKGNILAEVLALARERYPLVILDTPSLEDSASTLLFSRACDGVIMVLEAEATSVSSAEATIESVERSGGKILGLVFNKRRIHMPKWLFRRLS